MAESINTREFFRSIETLFKTEFQFLETTCGCRMRFIRRGIFWRWTAAYACRKWSIRIVYDEEDIDVYGLIALRKFGVAPVWLRGIPLESCIIALGGESEVDHYVSLLDRSLLTVKEVTISLASMLRTNMERLRELSAENWDSVKVKASVITRQRRADAEVIMRPMLEELWQRLQEDRAGANSDKKSDS